MPSFCDEEGETFEDTDLMVKVQCENHGKVTKISAESVKGLLWPIVSFSKLKMTLSMHRNFDIL